LAPSKPSVASDSVPSAWVVSATPEASVATGGDRAISPDVQLQG